MNFRDLTQAQAHLRKEALNKEALIGKIVGTGLKTLGKGALGAGKAANKWAWKGSGRISGGNKVMQGLTYAGGLTGAALSVPHAIGKARKYQRGFDPRIQRLK